MKFSLVQDSRLGGRRANQDRVGHWHTPETLLMLVSDGMGGHLHGEVAAQVSMDFFAGAFARKAQPRLTDPVAFLLDTVRGAHDSILRHAQARRLSETPRTVLVACVVQAGQAYWTHVGDCRLYLFRKGRIQARTRDHSVVQRLIDEGRIREEAAATHPQRNLLLQCLGGEARPEPEPVVTFRLAKDDVVLLCSDGFWGPLTQRQMVTSVISRPLKEATAELSLLAERRAGPRCDNLSLVAMAWDEDEVPDIDGPATIPNQSLATNVQDFTATDPDFLRMSDEEIERAIEEIKAALRKNSGQP
jgi:serine/threonine protein phosphatase PrpC